GELVSIIVTSILLVIENVFTALYHAYQASGQMKWAWWTVMTILACMIVVFIIRYFIIVAVATLFLVPLIAFFVKAFLTIVVATFLLGVQPTFRKFCTLSKIRHKKSQIPVR
ncbi:hypothetical protein MJT64_002688, partial [Listeria monocytogenes]|nr:hypothetical protein [Listeria monocytogenes]